MDKELYHHGILGQRWGIRRYQNKDGSLKIPKGTKLYRVTSDSEQLDSNRKYVTNNKKQSKGYEHMATGGDKVKLTLKTNKDLKLAGPKEVAKYMNDTFKVDINDQASIDYYNFKNNENVVDFLGRNYGSFENNQHVKKFISMGYDAVIDMKDYKGNDYLNMPIVLLKPDSDTVLIGKQYIT